MIMGRGVFLHPNSVSTKAIMRLLADRNDDSSENPGTLSAGRIWPRRAPAAPTVLSAGGTLAGWEQPGSDPSVCILLWVGVEPSSTSSRLLSLVLGAPELASPMDEPSRSEASFSGRISL